MLVPLILQASRWCLTTLFLGFASVALADATNGAWISRAWQSEEGLPGNSVVGIAQTPDGFLWVATESGLARFDGVRFRETAPLLNPNQAFLADRRGRLWLGKRTAKAEGEVVCLDASTTRAFGMGDGLPGWPVEGMAEDGEGAVWASAGGHACRIQEGRCTLFPSEAALPANRTQLYLASDRQGQLWFACRNQVGMYRDGQFHKLLTLKEPCGALSRAKSGGVWIGAGRRVLKYSGQGEPQDLGELAAGPPEVQPTVLCEDRRGRLWVGTEKAGLLLYHGAGFDEVALANREILCLTEDREGSLWVGSRGGGLVRVRPRAFELEGLSSGPSPDGMQSLCQDASGTLWAVTHSGRLARKEGPHWRVLSAEDGWSAPAAICVTAAPEGGVWVGTQSGGLRWWRQGEVRTLTQQDGLASRTVTALLTTPSGDVWVGTLGSNAVQRLPFGAPTFLSASGNEGAKPTGMSALLARRLSHLQTFMLPQILGPYGSLAVDASGGVWAATEGGVLTRVSRDALVDQTTNALGEHLTITSLCATPDGSLWIGYQGLGVGRLRQGRFTRFGTEQGLPDDYILHILADGQGRLWFAANRGLFSVLEKDFEAVAEGRQARVRPVVYGQEEGLPVSQAYKGHWPGALRSADGRLWIPQVSGLLVVDPSQLTENRHPPPVVLERVVVDGQAVAVYEVGTGPRPPGSIAPLDLHRLQTAREPVGAPTFLSASGNGDAKPAGVSALPARLRLAPGSRQVELEYTGLSFVSPRNVAFKYRLAGLERDWVEAGARRAAYYTRLPPGDYRFEVMACNNDGVWNEAGASLALTVLPHVWETLWFRLAALAAGTAGLVGTGWAIARRRARRRLAQMKAAHAVELERTRIARDIHDDLGASMTEIALLSELAQTDFDEPDQAKSHINEIFLTAQRVTRSVDEIVWAINPKNDAVEISLAYLCNMAQDYLRVAGINCRLELPTPMPARRLASSARHHLYLAMREALNNVVKHAAASEVQLRLSLEAESLVVVIADNGRGFNNTAAAVPPGARGGHGLGNMAHRLEAVGGRFELQSRPGQGTVLRLVVPLNP